jgi:tetratricopeptide (TPR) repeat protein
MERFGAVGTAVVLVGVILVLWMIWAWMKGQHRRTRTPRDAYTLGLSALIGGDRREALRHLRDAVQGDSDNIDAYLRLGDLLRESGSVDKALAVHRDLTVRPRIPESDRVLILESLTRDYLAGSDDAETYLRKLARHDRDYAGFNPFEFNLPDADALQSGSVGCAGAIGCLNLHWPAAFDFQLSGYVVRYGDARRSRIEHEHHGTAIQLAAGDVVAKFIAP